MKKILFLLFSALSLSLFSQTNDCSVFATVDDPNINCNDTLTITITGYSDVLINECFGAGGPLDTGWISTLGAQFDEPYMPSLPSTTCPPDNEYFWLGAVTIPTGGTVGLTSIPYDVAGGGEICFDFVYADGINGLYVAPSQNPGLTPEQPDQYNEGMSIQYSLNGGTTWLDIVYYAPNGDTLPANPGVAAPNCNPCDATNPGFTYCAFERWTSHCVPIPVGALSTSTNFRWVQELNSGSCCDHWGLDNIFVRAADPTYNAIMQNNNQFLGPSVTTVDVMPTTDSSFYFIYFDQTGDVCHDTLDVFINPTNAGPDLTVSCSTFGTTLGVTGVNSNSSVVWTPSMGLDTPTLHNPLANPLDDQMYTVTSDCGVDSIFVNVVPIFTPNVSTLNDSICAGDTTNLIASTDQPASTYTYEWFHPSVINGAVANAQATPSINTSFVVEIISDSGCIRQDSVMVFVGSVPQNVEYIGDLNICPGEVTTISAIPTQTTFFDNFNTSGNTGIWSDIQNGSYNTDCGSVSGDALHFDGIGDRWAQLISVDASLGGTISFDLIYGSAFGVGVPCADMGFNDIMQLEYSIDNGVNWTNINTYASNGFDNWTLVSDTIPAPAQTTNTLFRFRQPQHGGQDRDNWALDNFLLELNCAGLGCTTYDYSWSPTNFVSDPTMATADFNPPASDFYSLTISPAGFDCSVAADSIFIEVDHIDVSTTPSDTLLCNTGTVLLEGNVPEFSSSCDGDYSLNQIPLNTLTNPTVTTIPTLGDDNVSGTIPIPFNFEFFCEIKTSFTVSSNGFLSFSSTDHGCCSGENLPTNNPFNPNDVIAIMWADLNYNSGAINHFVTGTTPNRVMVIEFINIPHLGSTSTVSGQIQLHETSNIVEIHCVDCQTDGGNNFTMGIENSAGDMGYTPAGYNSAGWSSTNEAWRFIPSNSPALYSFAWSPNIAITDTSILSPLVSPTTSTDYVLSVTNINNCVFTDTAEVNVYVSNTTLTNDLTACAGDDIPLNAGGADTITWSPNIDINDTTILNPISTTLIDRTYYVRYATGDCVEEDSVTIDILNLPGATLNNGINPINFCEGETQSLFVDNLQGWTYSWNEIGGGPLGTGNTIDVDHSGTYQVSFFDGNCTNATNVDVVEQPLPIFNVPDKTVCCDEDKEIDMNALVTNTPVSNIYWNNVENTSGTEIVELQTINYVEENIVKAISIYGCEKEQMMEFVRNCLDPKISGADTVYNNTASPFTLSYDDINSESSSFSWATTDASQGAIVDATTQNILINGIEDGIYDASVSVTATYENGKTCTEDAEPKEYEVVVIEDPRYPDAFTPNGDAYNNVYLPVISPLAKIMEFRVYNRWGELLYNMETADNQLGWDGTHQGVMQPAETYTYYARIQHPDKEFYQEGTVALIK